MRSGTFGLWSSWVVAVAACGGATVLDSGTGGTGNGATGGSGGMVSTGGYLGTDGGSWGIGGVGNTGNIGNTGGFIGSTCAAGNDPACWISTTDVPGTLGVYAFGDGTSTIQLSEPAPGTICVQGTLAQQCAT